MRCYLSPFETEYPLMHTIYPCPRLLLHCTYHHLTILYSLHSLSTLILSVVTHQKISSMRAEICRWEKSRFRNGKKSTLIYAKYVTSKMFAKNSLLSFLLFLFYFNIGWSDEQNVILERIASRIRIIEFHSYPWIVLACIPTTLFIPKSYRWSFVRDWMRSNALISHWNHL